jgi:hypothetical protein
MIIKAGVRLLGIRPELVVAILVCESVYRDNSTEMWITSCVEGTHIRASKHYTGCAFDIRTSNLSSKNPPQAMADLIRSRLGEDFDVVLEKDHIHVEFDPKDPLVK